MSDKLYFEVKGLELLQGAGLTKAEFARRLGIHKQNVNAVFSTKNIFVLRKAAQILEVPFELLISYTEEPNTDELAISCSNAPEPDEDTVIVRSDDSAKWHRASKFVELIKGANFSDEELEWIKSKI